MLPSSVLSRRFRLPLLFVALLGTVLPRARATIPAAARSDALYAKGYLVVTHYPGVFTNETSATTTTAGLNEAIDDAYTNNLLAYFPPGTYLVNDTLTAHTATGVPTNAPGYTSATPRNHIAIIGATTGSSRPVIKLAASAAGFGNAGSPKPMLEFKNFDLADLTLEQEGAGYYQMLRGVDLNCNGGNGNSGAIGLYFNQSQDSSIENVKVTATGAFAGFKGLPRAAGVVVNIEVEGGQYGIDALATRTAGSVVAGAVLRNQTVSAVRYDGYVPLVLVGFEIVTPSGSPQAALTITAHNRANNSCVNLIDGRITLGAEPTVAAINNSAGMNFYARNVYVTGGNKLLKSGTNATVSGTGTWKRIEEYSYCSQAAVDADGKTSWTLIDGTATRAPAPLNNGAVSSITNNAAPPPADLLTRHVWTALPSVTDADAVDAYALGIQPGNVSSAAFQSVIDSHRKIFLRKGIYFLNGTITLRKDTILFGADRNLTRIEVQPGWNPTSETAMITTVNDATATTYLGELSIGVDATDLANDWFVALDWQAGRNSMVHMGQIYREPALTTPINRLPTNPHSLIKIRNAGGGRWYSTGSRKNFTSQHPAFRILKVEGTTEPLWFYGLNPEHPAGCEAYVQFTNASNIRIYAVKSEFSGNTNWEDQSILLRFYNATNVAQFGHGAIRNAVAGKGTIEFHNSDRVLATLIAPQFDNGTATGDTLREYVGTTNAGIAYPNVVSLYKRGVITAADEAAMTLTEVPSTPGGTESPQLSNLATRGSVNPGDETLIAGFAVSGPGAKTVLLRGIGPGLASFGVPGSLANPKLILFDANGATLAENDDWGSGSSNATATAFAAVGAFALNAGSLDAALVTTVNSGAYTVRLSGVGDASGVGLVEVYELDHGSARLVNLSSRLTVGSGASVGIAGFVVSGPVPKKFLIRGIGPTLAQFGVPDPLADPKLSVVGPASTVVAANDNWGTASNAADIVIASAGVGAFALPASSSDAAVLVTLPPGAYTASVSGANGTRGAALIEVYEVP
ncbi:MAG: glycosyl hydrolase family 28-related protein [Opitutaceae bacterium]|nr:glycosyl hydrolase family 28-related protein [Opitutaceae bacterium]